MQFWDIVTKKLRFHINQSTGDVFAIASTAKGLCALWFEGRIEIWNYKTGQYVKKISDSRIKEFQPQAIIGFATDMTANGALLALSARDANDIGLWDINTGHFIRFLKGHTSGINALKFSPDGRTLASCSDDGTIKLWRIK